MATAPGAPAANPRQRRVVLVAAVSVLGAEIVHRTQRLLDADATLFDCSDVEVGRTAP